MQVHVHHTFILKPPWVLCIKDTRDNLSHAPQGTRVDARGVDGVHSLLRCGLIQSECDEVRTSGVGNLETEFRPSGKSRAND